MKLRDYFNKKNINKLQIILKNVNIIYVYIKIKKISIFILIDIRLLIFLIFKELIEKLKFWMNLNNKIKV